jgi:hypothetical protein
LAAGEETELAIKTRGESNTGSITVLNNISAARAVSSTFGILTGLGGIWHGVGEVLQGNIAPEGIVIESWTQGPIATNMGGEPGMTIVPNLLITGILCIGVSLAVVVWAAALVQRNKGGLVLIFLSVAMLLVGGGFAPPLVGLLAGVAGIGINSPSTWWRTHLPAKLRRVLARLWPWVFSICVVSGLFLVVGSLILVHFFEVNNPDFFVMNFFFTILVLLLTILMGIAYDIQNRQRGVGVAT